MKKTINFPAETAHLFFEWIHENKYKLESEYEFMLFSSLENEIESQSDIVLDGQYKFIVENFKLSFKERCGVKKI